MSKMFPFIFLGDSFYGLWHLPFNNVTNLGVSASSIEDQRSYIEKPYSISHNGIIINAGTNNLGRNLDVNTSTTNYGLLIDYLKTISQKIYCVSVIPINKPKYFERHGATGHYLYSTPERISAINTGISTTCSQKGTTYIDITTSFSGDDGDMKTELTDDGIHPNKAGYDLYAEILTSMVSDLI